MGCKVSKVNDTTTLIENYVKCECRRRMWGERKGKKTPNHGENVLKRWCIVKKFRSKVISERNVAQKWTDSDLESTCTYVYYCCCSSMKSTYLINKTFCAFEVFTIEIRVRAQNQSPCATQNQYHLNLSMIFLTMRLAGLMLIYLYAHMYYLLDCAPFFSVFCAFQFDSIQFVLCWHNWALFENTHILNFILVSRSVLLFTSINIAVQTAKKKRE